MCVIEKYLLLTVVKSLNSSILSVIKLYTLIDLFLMIYTVLGHKLGDSHSVDNT